VRRELIGPKAYVPSYEWANGDLLAAARASLYRSMKDISGGGGMIGEPRLASAAKGAAIVQVVVDRMAEVLQSMWHAPPAAG
jgi:creatinine amidohydrolase